CRQVCSFPIHSHTNPGAATWMIEKDEFFQWCRVEFAVSTEFQCDFRHSIWLARSVDSKSIRFTFCYSSHRVDKRRGDEKQRAENQCEQRKSGRISNTVDVPFVAATPESGIEENMSNRKSDKNKNPKVGQ